MSNEVVEVKEAKRPKLIESVANMCGIEPKAFKDVLYNVIIKPDKCGKKPKDEQVMAFLAVAQEYKLNPVLKEIYAFPTKDGGIQPVVGVDGWAKLIREHPDHDGYKFIERENEKGDLIAITCILYSKRTRQPIEVTEYLSECKMDTDQWKKRERRMLRHKALSQGGRYAYGFSGIMDEDEAQSMEMKDVTPNKNVAMEEAIQKKIEGKEVMGDDAFSDIIARPKELTPEENKKQQEKFDKAIKHAEQTDLLGDEEK